MTQHRTLTRWFAAVLVAGTMVVGTMAPAQAAGDLVRHAPAHLVHPSDTGWNGT